MRDRRVRWLLVVLGVLLALLGVASWVSLHLTSRQTVVFSSRFPPAAAPASHPPTAIVFPAHWAQPCYRVSALRGCRCARGK